ncbi:hypothetical protein [Salibacterium lacus]|uniref:Phage protein n=1 Tax=Salibacterium lacus TaxID=1898109 RepID=A0ABW5SY85_9BACI
MADKLTQLTLTVKHADNVDMAELTDKVTDYIFAEYAEVHAIDYEKHPKEDE